MLIVMHQWASDEDVARVKEAISGWVSLRRRFPAPKGPPSVCCHFDPSHATGKRNLVPRMALASVVAGAHGVMVEVHPDPEHALSDGPQSLHFKEFEKLLGQISAMEVFMKKLRV